MIALYPQIPAEQCQEPSLICPVCSPSALMVWSTPAVYLEDMRSHGAPHALIDLGIIYLGTGGIVIRALVPWAE